jgi:hypothetical protein
VLVVSLLLELVLRQSIIHGIASLMYKAANPIKIHASRVGKWFLSHDAHCAAMFSNSVVL